MEPQTEMTYLGWLFMGLAWGGIIFFTVLCFWYILKSPYKREKE